MCQYSEEIVSSNAKCAQIIQIVYCVIVLFSNSINNVCVNNVMKYCVSNRHSIPYH